MKLKDIKVSCHEGYKSAERPDGFVCEGRTYAIVEITDRWYVGGVAPGSPCLNYFKVKTADGGMHLLRYNALFDAWALVIPDR